MSDLNDLASFIDHWQRRQLQDALRHASAEYWDRRANAFVKVGTPACFEIAAACMNAAALWRDDLSGVICAVCGTPTSPWTCSCGETRVGGDAA